MRFDTRLEHESGQLESLGQLQLIRAAHVRLWSLRTVVQR